MRSLLKAWASIDTTRRNTSASASAFTDRKTAKMATRKRKTGVDNGHQMTKRRRRFSKAKGLRLLN
jgi:hypothetical protein